MNTWRGKFPPPLDVSMKSMTDTGNQHILKPRVENSIVQVARTSRAFLDSSPTEFGLATISLDLSIAGSDGKNALCVAEHNEFHWKCDKEKLDDHRVNYVDVEWVDTECFARVKGIIRPPANQVWDAGNAWQDPKNRDHD